MRQKGKGKMGGSRMSMLKQMVDGFLDVKPREGEEKCPDGSDPPCEEEPPPPEGKCSDEQTAAGMIWNPETEECECPEGQAFNDETGKCEPGGETEVEEIEIEKPVLIRYDNDHVKVYAPRLTNTTVQEEFLSSMEKIQSDALIGRVDLEESLASLVGDVLLEMSDEKGTERAELELGYRGYRWDPDKWGAISIGKLNKKYKRTSKKKNKEGEVVKIKRIIPKYFYVFDKSLLGALEQVGTDENTVRMLAKWMIKMVRKGNKITLSEKEIKKLVTSLAPSAKSLEGKEQETINALSGFSIVKGRKSIRESLTLNRWKVLSGIK